MLGVYQRRPGFIFQVLQYLGVACLLLGVFEYFGNVNWFPIGKVSVSPFAVWS
jgi:hypothetical protein